MQVEHNATWSVSMVSYSSNNELGIHNQGKAIEQCTMGNGYCAQRVRLYRCNTLQMFWKCVSLCSPIDDKGG